MSRIWDLSRARQTPPIAPDGYYDWQVNGDASFSDTHQQSAIASTAGKVLTFVKKSEDLHLASPAKLAAFTDKVVNSSAENDRLGAFQDGLDILSKIPAGTKIGTDLANTAVGLLYNTIPHPIATFVGNEFAYRQADGSLNNVHDPTVGKSGVPYARSVQPKKSIHPSALPDPELIYETLLRARDRMDHLGGNSGLTFAFASLVTHSLFRTRRSDMNINDADSYLDLSPLYGDNQAIQDSIRNKDAGRGLLWPDTFAEERLLFLPPPASALLVLFSRNHNHIAEMLFKLNERKRWSDNPTNVLQQDEEIFQTARLVNCGHFMAMIMGDYVSGFLGLSEGNAWNMNAFDPIKTSSGEVTRGQGNHVSVEFNLLYRWHTTLSAADEKWTNNFLAQSFGGRTLEQVTWQDFVRGLGGVIQGALATPPKERTFGEMSRGKDGRFPDDQLAQIFQDATEAPAGQYRARGCPAALKYIEILGIEQGRQWGVCTMNEFRKWLGLKEFESFEEWNPDPVIANAARRLYQHIDNLELYTGLQCEQHMPLSDGLRFSCGYTMTRAVLSDAIALIRGDRFYTTDYTPFAMTSWGFQDCQRDPNNGGWGGALPKLLMRHFPAYYPNDNVYGIFPFFTPEKMKSSLTRQGIASQYKFDRPIPAVIPKYIDTFEAINYVFSDPARFKSGYDMSGLGQGYGFFLAMDDRAQHDKDRALALHSLFPDRDAITKYVKWWNETTAKEVNKQSWKYDSDYIPGNYVDIVNVIKAVGVHWAADTLCGISLKTTENPKGQYTVQEVFDLLATLFTYSFVALDDQEHLWSLRLRTVDAGTTIQEIVLKSLLDVAPATAPGKLFVVGILGRIKNLVWAPTDKPYYDFLSRLGQSGRPLNELVAMVVGLAVGSSVNQAHAAINVVDFYLDEERTKERAQIIALVQKDDANSDNLLQGYVREAMRLNPQFTGLWRVSAVDAEVPIDDKHTLNLKSGDRIWASFRNAYINPANFPNPDKVDPTRPAASYNMNGSGFHQCAGVSQAERAVAEVLRVVFKLKNIRRATGDAGVLNQSTRTPNFTHTPLNVYPRPDGTLSDWPISMHLVYDS